MQATSVQQSSLVKSPCDHSLRFPVRIGASSSLASMAKAADEHSVEGCEQADVAGSPQQQPKRITLRKPNLDSILGHQGNAGVPPELISIRKQYFQRHPLPAVRSTTDASKIYVRRNSIDSTSSTIKILNTGIKRSNKAAPVVIEKRSGVCMRRTLSGDSVEQIATRVDKENARCSSNRGKTIITISQIEKEKSSLQQQVSELVRNAETKKAEIASLKMEVNRLREAGLPTSDNPSRELETLRKENRVLRERLEEFERSGPMAIHVAEDKGAEGAAAAAKEAADALPQEARDWDKTSSSSMSEVSVACLQDRISQMEESHYSTNEELQATLQELQDLQDQVAILQMENENLESDKAVLYESLCSQTERLEESRAQVYKLKQLLIGDKQEAGTCTSGSTPVTADKSQEYLVDLLRSAQQEYDDLAARKEELASSVSESKSKMSEIEKELETAVVSMKELENKIGCLNEEKRQTELSLSESQKAASSLRIEVSVLKAQLEKEQSKVAELVKERDARATTELDVLLRDVRQDKERIETEAVKLHETLARTQLEASKLADKLKSAEQEVSLLKTETEAKLREMEERLLQESQDKDRCLKQLQVLETVVRDAETKCQRHLEDKRDLKATLSELQKQLSVEKSRSLSLTTELEDVRSRFTERQSEWKAFQDDLLTTVRVANDFKTEAQENVEKIVLKNRKLQEKNSELESEVAKLRVCQLELQRMSSTPDVTPPVAVVPPVAPRRSVSVSPVCYATPTSSPLRSISMEPVASHLKRELPIPRTSIAKWVELRNTSQLSVKSLIDSIESASKHKASKSTPTTPSSCLTSPSADAGVNGILAPEVSVKSPDDVGSQAATDAKDLVTESTTPKPLALAGKKYDGVRRNTISFSEMMGEKTSDPLADLVTGGGSKRNALLKWCQNKTSGYKNIDITNFSSSWNDGLAFCALLHTYLCAKIPYDELDCKDKKRNFQLAFDAAASVGIPSILDINEMISEERPDWHKVMAYVTSIYKHFET